MRGIECISGAMQLAAATENAKPRNHAKTPVERSQENAAIPWTPHDGPVLPGTHILFWKFSLFR